MKEMGLLPFLHNFQHSFLDKAGSVEFVIDIFENHIPLDLFHHIRDRVAARPVGFIRLQDLNQVFNRLREYYQ